MGTSLRRRRGAACAAAALSALVLSACLPGDGGDEESTGGATSSSSTKAEPSGGTGEGGGDAPTPYEADEFTEPQQRELTSQEAKKALPTRADMPDKNYVKDISDQDGEPWTYDPKECAAVEFASESARSFSDKHRSVREYARFGQSQADGGKFLGVWLHSYDEPYPLAYFDEAGKSLSECGKFTSISPRGHEFPKKTQAISAPQVDDAERTFAVRIIGGRVNTDRLYVRSGHNQITVMQQTPSDEPFDERLLTKHAEAVLADLKKGS